MVSPSDRFWAKVEKTDGCWLWRAATMPNGYGRFGWDRKVWLAHRAAYTMLVGAIPAGLQIDHLCRVRNCVNPAHLEAVDAVEHARRCHDPSAGARALAEIKRARTHCANGHEFTAQTEYWYRGARQCRACRCTHQQNYMARKRAAA